MLRLIALSLLLAAPAAADAVSATLLPPHPFVPGIKGLPRLAGTSAAEQKINAALQKTEAMLAEVDCRNTPGGDFDARSEVTLNGAGLLSLNCGSNWYCDSMAHPWWYVDTMLFDLTTGAQIDPFTFLPEPLRPPPDEDDDSNFTMEKALAAIKPLTDLYLAQLALDPANESAELNDMDCADVLTHDLHSFRIWPDAKAHALMIEPSGMVCIDTPCIAPVPLPLALLLKLHASPRLILSLAY